MLGVDMKRMLGMGIFESGPRRWTAAVTLTDEVVMSALTMNGSIPRAATAGASSEKDMIITEGHLSLNARMFTDATVGLLTVPAFTLGATTAAGHAKMGVDMCKRKAMP